ncbi:MAG: ArsA family ATPase [Acidobacteria bacterium]|nr:ArsA family ATPase [Acidobacteriota bacterium]
MRPALKAATTRTGNSPQFHFIGGKGGVGKTTCAAAFAIVAAKRGARVLVASTDPAPSLGDALTVRLSMSPRRVEAAFRRPGSLHAVEIDASAVLRRWIAERRATLEKIALEGTWLDRDDVDTLLNLSLPGIDEVAALLEIARFARTGRYDRIVVDTAPTGHTLRMLSMPETLLAVARVFDRMREKHRMMVEALRGRRDAAPEDRLIDDLASEAEELGALLTDGRRTHLSWVTLPEPMAVAETADALELLADRGIPVQQIVVNHVTPPPVPRTCRHCNARRTLEGRAVRALPALGRAFVVARDREPRGLKALAAIGRDLESDSVLPLVRSSRTSWVAGSSGHRVAAGDVAADRTRLLMFGGKGGVGKTTCAAAAAIAAAVQRPHRQVLLISTDPAHSLGDVLGVAVGDDAVVVRGAPPNLLVREMNAGRVLDTMRGKYAAAIDRLFDRLGGGGAFDIGHDRSVMHGLIDLAPPGLDELAAVVEITAEVSRPGDGLTVIDTAPTGHALRLLEMPALIHDWIKALMAILLKYQPVVGLGELGTLLVGLSQGLGRLRELLSDEARTQFIIVTRAAALPRLESERLLRRLRRLGINVPLVIANAVGRGTCTVCTKAAAAERREVAVLARITGAAGDGRALIVTAARVPPPQSAAALRAWQRTGWRYHQDA